MIICPHCQAINDKHNVACIRCGGMLIDDPALTGDPFVGREFGRRFRLSNIVGSGEIGMVYRGIDTKTDQSVAVKIIHPDVAAIHGDELLRWARRVAQIRHAKIASALGASREPDGTTYMVTEFVEGETLRSVLERSGPLPARRAADILFQLCSALAPVHRVDRPHANLKPENVFLISGDGKDFVKIVDVGSPVLFGVHHTAKGKVVIGAPKYFSPEQVLGLEVGMASDQFTLGIIGYQMLTGALPFYGATPDQLLEAIAHNTPTPVGERAAVVPAALAEIVDRCLNKRPEDRFTDLRALATAVATVIKTAPAPEPPPAVKKTFGAGRDLSTVVARPDQLPSAGGGFGHGFGSRNDAEATVLQDVPADIQALLAEVDSDYDAGAVAAATPLSPRNAPPSRSGPMARPTPPAQPAPLPALPRRPSFTGADAGDLAAALADAAASVREDGAQARPAAASVRARHTAPRVSPPAPPAPPRPATPAADDALAAALAAAAADVDDEGDLGGLELTPRAPSPSAGFDPFGSLDLGVSSPAGPPVAPTTDPVAPVGGPSRGTPLSSNDILAAIHQELDSPHIVAASRPPAQAASPLATAADFAALPVADRESVNLRPPVAGPRPRRGSRTGMVVLLLLLLGAAAAVAWYLLIHEPSTQVGEDLSRRPARPEPPKPPAPAALEKPIDVRLVSTPPGAIVFEGGKPLGPTPFDLKVKTAEPRSFVLKLDGHADLPYRLDPKALTAGEAPVEVPLALTAVAPAPVDAGAEPPKPDARPPVAAPDPTGQRRRNPPPSRRRATPSVDKLRDPFANP